MAYDNFSITDLSLKLGLNVVELRGLFAEVSPATIDARLAWYLDESTPVGLDVSTEKSRSEMIVAPILLEARRQRNREVSLFSGTEFSVDPERGLTGFCDFLFSLSPTQLEIQAPVIAIVEAKNEDFRQGIPQCAAEMFAARIFNDQRGRPIATLYGVVTTGSNWRFLRLRGDQLEVDAAEYYLSQVEQIVGVLLHMLAAQSAGGGPGSDLG